MKTVIHWFRRDFRLTDNTALNAAVQVGEEVVPVYILSSWQREHHWTGPNRQEFICACLRSLAGNLETVGARLIIRCGNADEELAKLVNETKAEAIFFNRDPDPFGRKMEAAIAKMAEARGVQVTACQDIGIHERVELVSGAGTPYRVYSPYANAWDKLPKPPVGPRIKQLKTPTSVASQSLPELSHWKLASTGAHLVEAGEKAARQRLKDFVNASGREGTILRYKTGRDRPSGSTTSRFSQDLRWGLLSPREIFHRCDGLRKSLSDPGERDSVNKYVREIAWRDFYMQILYHFPEVLDVDFNPGTRDVPWRSAAKAAKDFSRWQEGKTGFPIVDAGMRQLATTGFMHNRVRMIVSMFLTKDLHIHWREGEAHFNRLLVDGEIASNNGGWQWSAGTGADAAPYFRIQNPWSQSRRFDPAGDYIKTFVPELKPIPPERLHQPPAGIPLIPGYPLPMVDHGEERDRTLAIFRQHLVRSKGQPELPLRADED